LKYVGDKNKLRKPCKPCDRVMEGVVLGDRLLEFIERENGAVGLAANQVGVNAQVCAIKVDKPIVLVNPKIVGKFGKSLFQEACLSFPGDYVLTERWTDIVVKADNHRSELVFSFEKNALECVCVQHEIDHLNGILMFDRIVDMENLNG
jgi:peptide deformylase